MILDPPCPVCPGRPRHGRPARRPRLVDVVETLGFDLLDWQRDYLHALQRSVETGRPLVVHRGRRGGLVTLRDRWVSACKAAGL